MGAKINEYSIERTTFGDDDYYDIDYWDGSTYQTAKIKGITIKNAMGGGTADGSIYDNDGTLTTNRILDGDNNSFSLLLTDLLNFKIKSIEGNSDNIEFEVKKMTNNKSLLIKDTDTGNPIFHLQDGKVVINNSYALPESDGSANQIITTDGSGQYGYGLIQDDGVKVGINNAPSPTNLVTLTSSNSSGFNSGIAIFQSKDNSTGLLCQNTGNSSGSGIRAIQGSVTPQLGVKAYTAISGDVGNGLLDNTIDYKAGQFIVSTSAETKDAIAVDGNIRNNIRNAYALRGLITNAEVGQNAYAVYGNLKVNSGDYSATSIAVYGKLDIESGATSVEQTRLYKGHDSNLKIQRLGDTVDNMIGYHVSRIEAEEEGCVITNAYGLLIEEFTEVNGGNIDNPYGVFQKGQSTKNVYEGKSGFGTVPESEVVEVEGNVKVTGQVYSNMLDGSGNPITINVASNSATFDCDDANGQKLDLTNATGAVTLNFVGAKAGGTYFLKVCQKASSFVDIQTYQISGGSCLFPNGTKPVITATAYAIDSLVLFYDGTDMLINFAQNYS
jgi:hypothetical protein